MALAPPFRVLPQRYPVDHLAEALAEGIVVGHPLMPEFTFDPPEIDALLTYIESLSPSAIGPASTLTGHCFASERPNPACPVAHGKAYSRVLSGEP